VLLDFAWDLRRLFALELRQEACLVEDLMWHLDLPFRRANSEMFSVTPNDVRRDPARHPEQWARTLNADLSFPIHVMSHSGRTVILDGIHRLLKAAVEGRSTIRARRLSKVHLPAIALKPAANPRSDLLLRRDGDEPGGSQFER
jgi:hypothetical protein